MYEILLKSDLFKGLDKDSLDMILKDFKQVLNYKKDELVFLIGSMPENMYVLVDGAVEVYRESASGEKELLQFFEEPGVLFGEVYLSQGRTYDFSCQCTEDTILLGLDSRFLQYMIDGTGDGTKIILKNYIDILTTKTAILNRKVRILSGSSLRQKISRYLIEYSVDNIVKDNYNREELAQYLATTRPSISRELNNMKREGIIDIKKNKIIIVDRKILESNY